MVLKHFATIGTLCVAVLLGSTLTAAWDPSPKASVGWGDRDRTREILDLKRRVAALEKAIGEQTPPLVGPVGPSGTPGPVGPVGPAGAPPPDMAVVLKRLITLEAWVKNFRATFRIRIFPRKD